MKNTSKRDLYESIMTDVAKIVKKHINEIANTKKTYFDLKHDRDILTSDYKMATVKVYDLKLNKYYRVDFIGENEYYLVKALCVAFEAIKGTEHYRLQVNQTLQNKMEDFLVNIPHNDMDYHFNGLCQQCKSLFKKTERNSDADNVYDLLEELFLVISRYCSYVTTEVRVPIEM